MLHSNCCRFLASRLQGPLAEVADRKHAHATNAAAGFCRPSSGVGNDLSDAALPLMDLMCAACTSVELKTTESKSVASLRPYRAKHQTPTVSILQS